MKWNNPGHEYDELGGYFKNRIKTIYIIGDKTEAEKISDQLHFLRFPVKIVPKSELNSKEKSAVLASKAGEGLEMITHGMFSEFSEKLKKTSQDESSEERLPHCEVPIYTPNIEYIYDNDQERALRDGSGLVILEDRLFRLKGYYISKYGKINDQNIFLAKDFMGVYLSIFSLYVTSMVYIKDIGHVCTTVCTLNCKKCLNFAPYDQHKHHIPVERLKRDADIFFKSVDRIGLYHVTGGEPTTHPNLNELLLYIRENYSDRIYNLMMITNSSSVLSDELVNTLKRLNVSIQVDDYSTAVPRLGSVLAKNVRKVHDAGIYYEILQAKNWIDLFPPRENATKWDLEEKYDACSADFMSLKDGKIYTCSYGGFAIVAGVLPDCEYDYFDMNAISGKKEEKRMLVEFRNGFSKKGYSSFCEHCNGFPNINPYSVPAGEQVKGYLEWKKQ